MIHKGFFLFLQLWFLRHFQLLPNDDSHYSGILSRFMKGAYLSCKEMPHSETEVVEDTCLGVPSLTEYRGSY